MLKQLRNVIFWDVLHEPQPKCKLILGNAQKDWKSSEFNLPSIHIIRIISSAIFHATGLIQSPWKNQEERPICSPHKILVSSSLWKQIRMRSRGKMWYVKLRTVHCYVDERIQLEKFKFLYSTCFFIDERNPVLHHFTSSTRITCNNTFCWNTKRK